MIKIIKIKEKKLLKKEKLFNFKTKKLEQKHVKIFSGSAIMAMAVKNALEIKNIPYLERNDINSAITAGFGSADKAVHIFVLEQYEEQAKYALVEVNFDDLDEVLSDSEEEEE